MTTLAICRPAARELSDALHHHGKRSFQSAPLSNQSYISLIVHNLAPVPFTTLALFGPHYFFFYRIAAALPFLHLFVFEPCSAEPLRTLLLPAFSVTHGLKCFAPDIFSIRAYTHIHRGVVVGRESRLNAI